ncbi:hypothetical protein EXIGLDRAFT_574310, partial [Exidia glandulosa HHB12029]
GGRNLVVCIDGTSNQFSKTRNTNVVELYSRLVKNEHQLTFYNSGIGTYAQPSWKSLGYYKQVLMNKLDLAFALRFEKIILSAYAWLADHYQEGDRIFLFGFSRGAYQVRALSAMIETVGLIHKGNGDQIPFDNDDSDNDDNDDDAAPGTIHERFKHAFSRDVKVHFVGAWDTVSSVGIARNKTLPGTTDGMTHVCFFRHALALHERRVKFLPEYARGGCADDPATDDEAGTTPRTSPHTKEVWFVGCHGDMQFGPALRWMSFEALLAGVELLPAPPKWERQPTKTNSMTPFWRFVDLLPIKRLSY